VVAFGTPTEGLGEITTMARVEDGAEDGAEQNIFCVGGGFVSIGIEGDGGCG
jgi:hypothetical protein